MKKIILSLAAFTLFSGFLHAQLSEGGLPKSFSVPNFSNTHLVEFDAVDHDKILKENGRMDGFGPYMVSSFIPANISFVNNGSLIKNADGSYTWNLSISVPNSKGLGFYFDNFYLPQGVKMFIYNANKKHVLGAYTSSNNAENKVFATEPIQGTLAHIELNIPNESLIANITFNINRIASYFRGFDELAYFTDDFSDYYEIDVYDNALFGGSSRCMINAFCPQSAGYEIQRNASLQTIAVFPEGSGLCSATMVNNLGNSTSSCTKYILLASHCSNNSEAVQDYSDWILRYNYQQTTCERTNIVPNAKSITGAIFVARSEYNPAASTSTMKGDFLLLKTNSLIPSSWGVTMSGWNAALSATTSYIGTKKFIGFHHPGGDIKKLSVAKKAETTEVGAPNTHWWVSYTEGLGAQGSSGSGIFSNEGQVIGIASLAPMDASDSCKVSHSGLSTPNTGKGVLYSKMSYCWTNPEDDGSDIRKLQPWLDPANTGVKVAGPVSSSCAPLSIVNPVKVDNELNGDINIYPNPSTSDVVNIKIALKDKSDLNIDIYDISGKIISSSLLSNVTSEIFKLKVDQLSNGIYMVKCHNENGVITKRLLIQR